MTSMAGYRVQKQEGVPNEAGTAYGRREAGMRDRPPAGRPSQAGSPGCNQDAAASRRTRGRTHPGGEAHDEADALLGLRVCACARDQIGGRGAVQHEESVRVG